MGLIKRIWNGELPLSQIYWGYGVGVGVILSIPLAILDGNAIAILLLMLTYLPYQAMINVGVWRAADKYKKSLLLAWLAKIGATLGTLYCAIGTLMLLGALIMQNNITHSSNFPTPHTDPNAVVLDEKLFGKKIGSTWSWEKLDVKKANWWVETSMRKRNKFNIVSVWLKTESIKRAKVQGADYDYSVVGITFSCGDATYHTDSITDVFYVANRADEDVVFEERFNKKFKKIESTEKYEYLVKAYSKVCQ